jgi:hypothetical protein
VNRLVFLPTQSSLTWHGRRLDINGDETAVLILLSARPGHWFLWSEIKSHGVQYGWPERRLAGLTSVLYNVASALIGTTAWLERSPEDAYRFMGVMEIG